MKKAVEQIGVFITTLFIFLVIPLLFSAGPAHVEGGKTIVDLWSSVKAPPPVTLDEVKIDPAYTALLILDIEQRTCNAQDRPRCVDSAPKIKAFLKKARSKGIFIVYSNTNLGTPRTILPEVKPQGHEPIVKSGVDKFYNTDLEKILRDKGISLVIIVGTTAEGAVLHTANGAAMRGFQVVIPVDGFSAGNLYAEQYTAWDLVNAPGTRQHTTLSRLDMIKLK
jgi:nicotinamidase-related amidase